MADDGALPPYNALFPEEDTEVVVHGRRRHTTITLREIYYPGGCPCHPKERKPNKRSGKSKQERPGTQMNRFEPDPLHDCMWMGHSPPTINERIASHSTESSSRSSSSASSTNSSEGSLNASTAPRRDSTAASGDSKASRFRPWDRLARRTPSSV